jgi:hypothetical protein
MTNTTTETLAVGGTVLNTLGYNIDLFTSTVGQHTRSPRHVPLPRRDGVIRQRPFVEPTPLMLSMWVSDRNVAGVPNGTTQMWTNLDILLALLAPRDSLVAVQKIRQSAGGLVTLDAEAELVGPVDWALRGNGSTIQLTAPMIMPYPYWEGAQSDTTLTDGNGSVTNNGHVEVDRIQIDLIAGVGGWTNPSIVNSTLGITLDYTGTVTASQTYVINLWDGTAVDHTAASIAGAIDLTGSHTMTLAAGSNTFATTDGGGTGDVRFRFDPPYLG